MSKITNLKLQGGNFVATVSGDVKADKLQAVLEAGITKAGYGAWGKVFKGVKTWGSVAFSADGKAVVEKKLREELEKLLDGLTIEVGQHTKKNPGKAEMAKAAYDASLADPLFATLPDEMRKLIALKAAQSHQADFDPTKVEAPASIAPTPEQAEAEQQAAEQPTEG